MNKTTVKTVKTAETEKREEILQSCIHSLQESKESGIETSIELVRQGKQLENIDAKLANIDENIERSGKLLKRIKSIWATLFTKLSPPKKLATVPSPKRPQPQSHWQSKPNFQSNSSQFQDKTDRYLDQMSNLLTDLQEIGMDLNNELSSQNEKLDKLDEKTVTNDAKLDKLNQNIKNML